jgi:hypothetical protein
MKKTALWILAIALALSSAQSGFSFNTDNPREPAFLSLAGKSLVLAGVPGSDVYRYVMAEIGGRQFVAERNASHEAKFSLSSLPKGDYALTLLHSSEKYGAVFSSFLAISTPVLHWKGSEGELRLESGATELNRKARKALRTDEAALKYFLKDPGGMDPSLSALASKITAALASDYEKAKAIHAWVSERISYDTSDAAESSVTYAVERGDSYQSMIKALNAVALSAYKSGKGVCLGIAALEGALLRSSGIPAIYVGGRAEEDEKGLLDGQEPNHAWLEAFVEGRWMILDPTWDALGKGESFLYFDPTLEIASLKHAYTQGVPVPPESVKKPEPGALARGSAKISHASPSSILISYIPVEGAEKYEYYVYTASKIVAHGYGYESSAISGLNCGEFYTVRVAALRGEEKGEFSAPARVRARPLRPASLTAAGQRSQVRLTWAPVAECDGYAIYRSASPTGPYSLERVVSGKDAQRADIKVPPSSTAHFKVCSYKQVGQKKVPSAYTGQVSATAE